MDKKTFSIVFFWVGENISIPTFLVNSIKIVMGDKTKVVQLTNLDTEKVPGVTSVQRFNLSDDIMIARLQAYAKFENETDYNFYCDADCVFINKLSLPNDNKNIFISPRQNDFIIDFTYPEFYEEFIDKTANQVMPYLFGALATKGDQKEFFNKLLNICLDLPKRFHRWYGDQYALFLLTKDNLEYYGILDPFIYQHVINERQSTYYLETIQRNKVQMLHFKGPDSKFLLESAIEFLEKKS